MRVGFVTQIFPWITQTFTYNEVVGWGSAGIDVEPIAFHRPSARVVESFKDSDGLKLSATHYTSTLGAGPWLRGVMLALRHPLIAASTLAMVATQPYARRTTVRLRATAIWSWVRALPIAALAMERKYDILHADFADQAATSAWVASRLAAIPFSFRSHGSFNTQLIREKVRDAAVVLCISAHDRDVIAAAANVAEPTKVVVSYLGVDVAAWGPTPRDRGDPVILCVGTLQEKKGQRYLIDACALLQRKGIQFRCILVGDGPDKGMLRRMISSAGLDSRVEITGYKTAAEVRAATEQAMIVCVPCVVAGNGDADGLPIALIEGMAAAKPCVSTWVAGIPELIVNGASGILIPERDHPRLAQVLELLLHDPTLRRRLGEGARQRVEAEFELGRNTRKAIELLRQSRYSVPANARRVGRQPPAEQA